MNLNRKLRRGLVVSLLPVFILGCDVQPPFSAAHATTAPQAQAAPASARTLPDFSALVEREGPAVVAIATTQTTPASAEIPFGTDPNDPLFEFFRRFRIPGPQGVPTQGIGSGFIVSSDGYILTNAHVVANASEVTVKLADKRELKAKVVGSDRKTDIALLKIPATGLPVVRIGDPSRTKVGEWVAAMGSPFGFDNTVTAGIVSAKARSLPEDTYVPFIQTDAAVNPGNSGGPLFNMAGEVIAVNSQIYSRSGGYMGLAFAIPIDVAMKVKDQLLKYGKASHGRLGVVIQDVNQDLAESFGMKKPAGALVSTVEKGGPADRAGLQPGDVILSYNGTGIERSSELPRLVGETKPGDKAKLRVWRGGAERELMVEVGELPREKTAQAGSEAR